MKLMQDGVVASEVVGVDPYPLFRVQHNPRKPGEQSVEVTDDDRRALFTFYQAVHGLPHSTSSQPRHQASIRTIILDSETARPEGTSVGDFVTCVSAVEALYEVVPENARPSAGLLDKLRKLRRNARDLDEQFREIADTPVLRDGVILLLGGRTTYPLHQLVEANDLPRINNDDRRRLFQFYRAVCNAGLPPEFRESYVAFVWRTYLRSKLIGTMKPRPEDTDIASFIASLPFVTAPRVRQVARDRQADLPDALLDKLSSYRICVSSMDLLFQTACYAPTFPPPNH